MNQTELKNKFNEIQKLVDNSSKIEPLYELLINSKSEDHNFKLRIIDQLIPLCKEANNHKILYETLMQRNIVYYALQKYHDCIECINELIALCEEMNDKEGMVRCLNFIGSVNSSMGFPDKAIEYLQKGLKLAEEDNLEIQRIRISGNLGFCYRNIKDMPNAEKYTIYAFEKSVELKDSADKEKSNLYLQAVQKLAGLYFETDKYNELEEILPLAIDKAKKLDDSENLYKLYSIYTEISIKKGDYSSAEKYLKLQENIGSHNIEFNIIVWKNYCKVYEQTQDFAKIHYYTQKIITALEDKLNYQKESIQQEMLVRFDVDSKEKEAVFEREKNLALQEKNRIIEIEKKRSDDLLRNVLPDEIAEELKNTSKTTARSYSQVTVLFADIKNFTVISSDMGPEKLIEELDFVFGSFDSIIEKYKIEKIKIIGDCYMCVGGVPHPNSSNPIDVVSAAIDIQRFMTKLKEEKMTRGEKPFEVRIGINTGPIVAGVLGIKKFAYDVWGDTVNIASRLETAGEAGKINISDSTYQSIKDKLSCTYRGKIEVKGKGALDMYFVNY